MVAIWETTRALRRIIPINHWTPVLALVGCLACLLLWRRLARWLRWRPFPTLLSLLSLIAVLSLTLSPKGWWGNHRTLAQCVPSDWAEFDHSLGRVGDSLESWLNIAMLIPLGFGLVLACRRAMGPAAFVVLLPVAIELTQVVVPGRECSAADWVANALGGLLGVAVGALANRWLATRPPRPGAEQPPTGAVARKVGAFYSVDPGVDWQSGGGAPSGTTCDDGNAASRRLGRRETC